MAPVDTIAGFSLTNRLLLYTSILLAPAQGSSGWKSNCPSNIGFLAYNMYTQISWYAAARARRFHALALLVPNFNAVYAVSYLPGIVSGNALMGGVQGLVTAGLIVLNSVVAWTSWKTNLPDGIGEYQFFFFGWRTLSVGWYRFMFVWEMADTLFAASLALFAAVAGFVLPSMGARKGHGDDKNPLSQWSNTLALIPIGAAIMLSNFWPVILWTELIVARNHVESATDWVAVWLFVAQVVTMLVPTCGVCTTGARDDDEL